MPDLAAIRARLAAVENDIEYLTERGREDEITKMEKQYVWDVSALLAALDELYGVLLYELTMNCTEDEARDYIAKRCASFRTQAAGVAALDAKAQKEAKNDL